MMEKGQISQEFDPGNVQIGHICQIVRGGSLEVNGVVGRTKTDNGDPMTLQEIDN